MHPQHFAKPLFPISPGYYSRPKKNRRQWYVCMYGLCEKDELTPASLFGKIWVVSQNLIVIFLTAAAHTTKKQSKLTKKAC